MRNGTLTALTIASLGCLAATPAAAQQFPSKTVRIIVPFTPGSILDPVSRFVASKSIHGEFVKALNSPDVKPMLEAQGMLVVANTPPQFAEVMQRGFERYGRAVKLAGIQPKLPHLSDRA